MGRKRESLIWDQFEETTDGFVKCIHCQSKFKGNLSVTQLQKHLLGVEDGGIGICTRVPDYVKNALADGSSKRRRIEWPSLVNNNEFDNGGNGEPAQEVIQRMRQRDSLLVESMAAKGFTGSSSSSCPSWKHDVFLSFRGEDTRKNFTDHLYTALTQAGVQAFREKEELPRGKGISSEPLKAIQESRIAVIVLSKDFASSHWCLDELAEVIECKNKTAKKWREALGLAANLSGWTLQNMANGHEAKFIQMIVGDSIVTNPQVALKVVHGPTLPRDQFVMNTTSLSNVSIQAVQKLLWVANLAERTKEMVEKNRIVTKARKDAEAKQLHTETLCDEAKKELEIFNARAAKLETQLTEAHERIKELEAEIQAAKELRLNEYKNSKACMQMPVEHGKTFYSGFEEAMNQFIAAHPNLDISFMNPYKVDGGLCNRPTNTEMASTDVQGHD